MPREGAGEPLPVSEGTRRGFTSAADGRAEWTAARGQAREVVVRDLGWTRSRYPRISDRIADRLEHRRMARTCARWRKRATHRIPGGPAAEESLRRFGTRIFCRRHDR